MKQRIEKNFVIRTPYLQHMRKARREAFISLFFNDEPVVFIKDGVDILDLLVTAGIYETRSKAKDAWRGEKKLVDGLRGYHPIGKIGHVIWVFNPKSPRGDNT